MLKDRGLWVGVIPAVSLKPTPSSLPAYFHSEWLFSRVCDAASLCALWGLAVEDFEDEDPGTGKVLGCKSQLEERDGGFRAERRASLRLGWISSGFCAALTLNWS